MVQLCTWDSNLRLYLIVKGVLRQLETNNCSLFTCLATTMKRSQFVSMMHYLVNLVCTDYQNRALMKYLELMSLDGNREASELTDGEIYKYNQQNYEMLKDREERSTIITKFNSQGSHVNTSNTICTISYVEMSVTHTFAMFCTNQQRWIKYIQFFYSAEFILEVEVALLCFDKAVGEDDEWHSCQHPFKRLSKSTVQTESKLYCVVSDMLIQQELKPCYMEVMEGGYVAVMKKFCQ